MQLSKEFLDGLATEIPKMVEAFSNPTTEQTESRKKSDYKEQKRLDLLLSLSKKIAPDLAYYNSRKLTSWSGFRPLTPSSYPRIGPTSKTGLQLNSGQGFYWWTLACASGKKLAEYF